MADFAARVSQGHIGRARYIATNEHVRSNRAQVMKLPLQLTSIAAAFQAAQTLVDLATQEANAATDARDEAETQALAEAYGKGATGRGMATGGCQSNQRVRERTEITRHPRRARFIRWRTP
jgi:DNA polymerase III subunit delta'